MSLLPKARPTVLIVDDDIGVAEALHLILDDHYDLIEARNGGLALSQLKSCRVDVILLDLLMDGIDGISLLRMLRARGHDIPVVIISGLNNAWTAAAAMRLGAVDYIVKPFEDEDLLATIDSALGIAAAAKEVSPSPERARILLVGCPLGVAGVVSAALVRQAHVESVPQEDEALAFVSP